MRVLSLFLLTSVLSFGQTGDSKLDSLIELDPVLNEVFGDSAYRLQFMFLSFETGKTYSLNNNLYFYPASTVKLPVAIVALEKMNRLGITLDDKLILNDNTHCGNRDFVHESQLIKPTFRSLIEELIVVSDNDNYNALYHFVTPGELNYRLNELGFVDSKIYRSFSRCDKLEHLHTNSLKVLRNDSIVYYQPERILEDSVLFSRYTYTNDRKFGSRHEYRNKIVNGPFDLNYHLEVPLAEIFEMMWRLSRPDDFMSSAQWSLPDTSRTFLMECLRMFPKELPGENYTDTKVWPDNIYKYAVHGDQVDTAYTVYNKLGLSYGFTTEIAYIVNNETEAAYLLSVSMYTNYNDIVNDGKYEYESIARPFIAGLSRLLIQND